ncbi:acyl-CoA N-acyltransferase [Sporodiniella umbellata]|nr:acyl-CoA N-acyltransferase [Sporodiniella umbellata]
MEIILANESHATLLTKLGKKLFGETFSKDNTNENMSSYLDETYNIEKQIQELNDPGWITLMVMNEEGEPIAFSQIVETEEVYDFIPDKQAIELKRIYVDKRYIGKGVGKMLLLQVLEEVRRKKKETLWLGVWENNHHALEFYKKHGFEVVGDHVFQLGEQKDRDLVMTKKL